MKFFNNFARYWTAAISPQPMVTVPSSSSLPQLTSASVFARRSKTSSARRLKRYPSLVRESGLLPFIKSVAPISFSSIAICRLKVGCVMCSTFAAFVIILHKSCLDHILISLFLAIKPDIYCLFSLQGKMSHLLPDQSQESRLSRLYL